jgi:putative transposase
MELRCFGKYGIVKACQFGKATLTQEMLDLYWSWLWDPKISGNPPTTSEDLPMVMSEMTCTFGPSDPEGATTFSWWLRCSTLQRGKTVAIPLSNNPYLTSIEGLAKTVMAQKRNGNWVFQFCEKAEEPEFDGSKGEVGVDVGLNVLAATSDGRLYGQEFKSKFDHIYKRVTSLRANRQRQGLKRDSKRLARLEAKLSGMIKTATGTVANQLIKDYPKRTFVIEDLDLRGCRGQKRFAYRALHHSLATKAKVKVVNPAYSSQMCPSCGYVSRTNRHGIKFCCKSCGRISHADVVGGVNLLGRSEDKQIDACENHFKVKQLLRERYLIRRNPGRDSSVALPPERADAPEPSGRRLTTRSRSGTASNSIPGTLRA